MYYSLRFKCDGHLADLDIIFRKRGVRLELVGRKHQLMTWFKKAELKSGSDGIYIHSNLYLALRINQSKQANATAIKLEAELEEAKVLAKQLSYSDLCKLP